MANLDHLRLLAGRLKEREEAEQMFVAFEGRPDTPERFVTALRLLFEHDSVEPVSVSHLFAEEGRATVIALVVTTALVGQAHSLLADAAAGSGVGRGLVLLAGDIEQRTEEFEVPAPEVRTPLFAWPVLHIDPDARLPFRESLEYFAQIDPEPADLGILPGFESLAPERLAEEAEHRAREAAERARREALESGREIDWDEAYGWTAESAEWVPVASAWGYRKDAEIALACLLDAGIPAAFDRVPFTNMYEMPLGGFNPSRILVPPSRLDEAQALLAATCQVDADADGQAAEEIAEEQSRAGLWQTLRWVAIAGIVLVFVILPLVIRLIFLILF